MFSTKNIKPIEDYSNNYCKYSRGYKGYKDYKYNNQPKSQRLLLNVEEKRVYE